MSRNGSLHCARWIDHNSFNASSLAPYLHRRPLCASGDTRSGMRATPCAERGLFSLIATSVLALSCLAKAHNLILSSPTATLGILSVDT